MLGVMPARPALPDWLQVSYVAARLEQTLPVTLALVIACLAVPALLGFSNLAYVPCAFTVSLLVVPFVLREPPSSRRLFFALWALAFALRLALLVTLYNASVRAGGPFLGPDSTQFLRESRVMADRAFALGAHPIAVFETYDVAHYYIYAFLIRAFNADLFALQLFNCGLTALAAPLMYSVGRVAVPRWAVLFGLLVAINPSLMVLSIRDLLKDPSILCAVSIAAWALVHVGQADRWTSTLAYGVTASAALAYLHMDRFYVAAYLEIAAVVTLGVLVSRGHGRVRAGVVLPVLLVFVVSEAVPMALGWRSSASILYEQVRFVNRSPAMLHTEEGMTQRALRSRSEMKAAAKASPDVKTLPAQGDVKTLPAQGDVKTLPAQEDVKTLPAQGEQETSALKTASFAVSVVKRVFGPFVWVLPEQWTVRELLRGDYMLYPGTLVWYFVLPLAAIGCVATAVRVANGRECNALLIGLTAFCLLYFAQYIAINLSFRQRDTMFPFAALFAFVGGPIVADSRRCRRLLLAYWLALAAFACAHLVLRYFLT